MPYFARFRRHGGATFRFDTRIYLRDEDSPSGAGKCVGAIIGKNPGSAQPTVFDSLATLALSGDKMLPSVRNRFIAAYGLASKPISRGAFVQVWNLFYLCDANLDSAIARYGAIAATPSCESETMAPPLVWIAWGGRHMVLDAMKERFGRATGAVQFFYDKNRKAVIEALPTAHDFPKHPQGLPADPIVAFIAARL